MSDEAFREPDQGSSDIPATPVFFAHARAYDAGYVIDLHDVREGEAQQWAMEWAILPAERDWTPHQAVEYFLGEALSRVGQVIEDRDLVLYFECLAFDCHAPHLVTRAQLEQAGFFQ